MIIFSVIIHSYKWGCPLIATQLTGNMRTTLVDCLLVGVHSHKQGKSKLLPYHTTIDKNYLQFTILLKKHKHGVNKD